MAVLVALGAMSLIWMALVAVLIAAERLTPLSSPARAAGAVVVLALAVGVAAMPGSVPGLTIPGSRGADRDDANGRDDDEHAGARAHTASKLDVPLSVVVACRSLDRPRCSR
jgi:hypothetical protein